MPNCNLACDRFIQLTGLSWGEFTVDPQVVKQHANGQGGLSYGAFDQIGLSGAEKWFLVDLCTGSDYSGDLLNKSNFRTLLKMCELALQEQDTCQKPWFVDLHGGHDTFALALHCERVPQDVYDTIEHLVNDYLIIDEDDYSELQHEAEEEAWPSWASHDFKRALEKKFPSYDFDTLSDGDLYEIFHKAMEDSNTYWEVEGMGVRVDIERILKEIDEDDLPGDKQGWKMNDDLDGLRRPKTSGTMKVPAWVRPRPRGRR